MVDKLHVMIVDDQERLVRVLQKRLERRGFVTTGVTSGEEALHSLSSNSEDIAVMVLDIKMEGMDGIEVLRQVQKRFPTIQVILHTGNATIQNGIEGLELGAFYYVQKPCPVEEMVDLIQSASDRRLRKMNIQKI